MNNSTLFKQAHIMTKQVIKQGDCYRTTFGLCLKAIKDKQAEQQTVKSSFVMLSAIAFVMFINKRIIKMFYKSIKNQPNVTCLVSDTVITWHFRQGKVIRYKSTYNGISTFTEYQAYNIKPYIMVILFITFIAFII